MSSTLTIGGKTVQDITIGAKQVQSIYDNTHQVLLWERVEPNYFYFEDRSGADNSISIAKTGDQAEWLALEYSTDKNTWNTWDFSQRLTLPANGKVYLRGDNTIFMASAGNFYSFGGANNVYAGGSVRSLFNKNVPDTINSTPRMFACMFFNMQTLVGVDINLFKGINYVGETGNMFNSTFRSTNIVTPPDLSDIHEASTGTFRDTFYNCSLLETAPAINITNTTIGTTNQFKSTFYNCNALVDASPMRVSSTNTNSSLFYETFRGCNNLVVPPDLTGVTVLGKQRMYRCFYGCSSLTSIKVGFTQWGSDVETDANYQATKEWTYDINTNGVFIAPSTLPKTRNSADNTTTSDYIPTNWSIADLNGKLYAPVITNNNNTITIAEAEGGASCQIFYTVDGTTPTPENGTLYTQPFTVGSGVTVKAISHYNGNRADLITDSDYAEVVTPGSSLPNVSYMFNYNAKEFDTTTNTFPKSIGQTFNQDLVLTSAPYSTNIADGYVTLDGSSYMDVGYETAEDNIFNRYDTAGNNTLTIVYKVNWSGTGGGEAALLGNRGSGTLGGGNDWNYMLRHNLFHVTNGPSLTTGTNLGIYYVRVNSDASCIYKCVTNNAYTENQNISYGSPAARNFTFFGDSDYSNSTSLHYQGDFYWFYLSNEALTDQQIQQVIDYNENLSV